MRPRPVVLKITNFCVSQSVRCVCECRNDVLWPVRRRGHPHGKIVDAFWYPVPLAIVSTTRVLGLLARIICIVQEATGSSKELQYSNSLHHLFSGCHIEMKLFDASSVLVTLLVVLLVREATPIGIQYAHLHWLSLSFIVISSLSSATLENARSHFSVSASFVDHG
jgi:hypothetical protein